MKLFVVLLLIGVDFVTSNSQETKDWISDQTMLNQTDYGLLNLLTRRKCDTQHFEMRIKVMIYYDRLNELCGYTTTTTPCPTSTTTTTTTTTTSTSTTTTTTSTTTTTTTTTTPCTAELTKLIAITNGMTYYYTTKQTEADAQTQFGFSEITSPGRVSLSMPCTCGDMLIPIYTAYNQGSDDHLYTEYQAEITGAAQFGYADQGIAFYCSKTKGLCGATLALYRFVKGAHHIEVTDQDLASANGATYEGIITCYVWPS